MEPVLSIRDLCIDLPPGADRVHAVRSISFGIHAGEVVCLIGESGSGKSVVSRCVMGLLGEALRVSSGSIFLNGEDLLTATKERLRRLRGTAMTMVFQEPMTALNPVMTCGAQLDELLLQHTSLGRLERRRRIEEIFERVRLSDPQRVYESYPHQLSGGQRQRIVIAMATVMQPVLLICDEPTTALDVTTQAEILRLVNDLRREYGTAVLFITHDFGVVADVADRVVVLRDGDIVEMGDKSAVFSEPQHEYTRMLLDAVPSATVRAGPALQAGKDVVVARGLGKVFAGRGWFRKPSGVAALQDVSMELRSGETLGVVGESGSGKSTLARCIARLHEADSGTLEVDGYNYALLDRRQDLALRRKVQMVFQDPYRSLNPRCTVGESMVEGPRNFGVPADVAWERARELMRQIYLSPQALDRYPHQFSGGQRQRICIARALACEPEILIADEAVSALDVSVQAEILKLLREIRLAHRFSMLFITHDLRVAGQICDRVIVMRQGSIVEQGDVNQVFTHPAHDYTRALLASLPGRGFDFAQHGLRGNHQEKETS